MRIGLEFLRVGVMISLCLHMALMRKGVIYMNGLFSDL
jgi:hypothetical protein